MTKNYSPDLRKYTMKRFQSNLKKRKLIPSRIILQEAIDEKFKILSNFNIHNIEDLITTLSTRDKIKSFTVKSGLNEVYLTVLKREASSYKPKPISLKNIPDIYNETLEKLEHIGITNTKKFFEASGTNISIQILANKSSISIEKLKEIRSLSDLLRLYGVGPVFARMIYNIGIRSLQNFIQISPEEFIRIYERETNKKADFSISDIEFSLEIAAILYEV
jgi:Domain of unknown function (DUF4332)